MVLWRVFLFMVVCRVSRVAGGEGFGRFSRISVVFYSLKFNL